MTEDEWNLLQRFARSGDQDAFGSLARRYVDFVYGSCLRQLGDAHLAEDVTQGVFLVLATKGKSLPREAILSGWLFSVTRYACRNAMKMRTRRSRHERAAARPIATETENSEGRAMDELKAVLDEAISRLRQADRHAVLLRYFQGNSVKDVAAALGISEDAAGKRLSRVIAQLRAIFARRGIMIPAASAASAIAAASSAHAPSGVHSAAADSAKPSHPSSPAITIARATMHTMRWALIKSAVASAAAAMVVIGCGGVLAHQAMAGRSPALAVSIAPAPAPAAPPGMRFVTAPAEMTIMCHWEVVVSPSLARAIESLGKPAATDSRGYQAYVCNGESLVSALRAGRSDNTLLATGSTFEFPSSLQYRGEPGDTGSQLSADADTRDALLRPLFCRSTGKLRSDISGPLVHLNLRVDDAEVTRTAGGHPVLAGTMHFKGDIAAGSALVLLGQFPAGEDADADDVQVWQTFVCPTVAWNYLESPGTGIASPDRRVVARWIDLGVKATIEYAVADAEWNWHAPAAAADHDPRWTRTLSDGTTVQLLAVCNPASNRVRWWSPTGQRVASPISDGGSKPSAFPLPPTERTIALQITGPAAAQMTSASGYDDITIQNPDANPPMFINGRAVFPAPAAPQPSPPAAKVVRFSTPATPRKPIRVMIDIGVGPWKNAVALRSGRAVHVGKIEYQLVDVETVRAKSGDDPGATDISMRYTDSPEVQTTVAAVRKDGSEVLFAPLPRQIAHLSQTQPSITDYDQSGPIDAGEIDHVEVKTRSTQHIEFTGICADPTVAPPKVVFPPTLLPEPIASPPEFAPAPGSAAAAMAEFQAAARAGDAKRLRADCYVPDASAGHFADAHVRLAIAATKLLQAAETRFGKSLADQTLAEDWSIEFWAETADLHWQSTGHTAILADKFDENDEYDPPALRRVHGQWLVDCTNQRGNMIVTLNLDDIQAKIRQLDQLTAATSAGKYQTIYDLRDDLVQDRGGNVMLGGR